MDLKKKIARYAVLMVIGALVLALSVTYNNQNPLRNAFISFALIISINFAAKEIAGYILEIDVNQKFWEFYQYGFRKDFHFKRPIPMVWLPLLVALISKGAFFWLGIFEFDVEPRVERATRRHGLYRFTQVTEWHIAWIALWGIIANVFFAAAGYLAGFELFSKLSIYFAVWNIVPLSSLDGSKIFFSSRPLWITAASILFVLLLWTIAVV